MSAPSFFRAETVARLAAQHAANVAAAADRREIAKVARAANAVAEWDNLLTMAAQGGRPPSAAKVQRMGRAAKVGRAEIARVVAAIGAAQ